MLYLAVDSGGSKTRAVMFYETGRIAASASVGSMRSNSTPPEVVRANAVSLCEQLFDSGLPAPDVAGGIIHSVLRAELEKRGYKGPYISVGEPAAALAAAEIEGDGLICLSGTGATMFGIVNGKGYSAGGFGSAMDDEGSGYWIGRRVFQAGIRDAECRGPHTLLTGLIKERYHKENFRDAAFSIYKGEGDNPGAVVTEIAACAPLAGIAARAGDAVAMEILKDAGTSLASQICAFIRVNDFSPALPVVLSGSVWKAHPILLQTYRKFLEENGILNPVVVPRWEPLAGMVRAILKRSGYKAELSPDEYKNCLYKLSDD